MTANNPNIALMRSVVVLGAIVAVCLTALAIWGPSDNPVVATVINSIGTTIAVIVAGLFAMKSSALNSAKIDDVTQKVADVNQKVSDVTVVADATHTIVNSQRSDMIEQIADLRRSLEEVRSALKSERAVTAYKEEEEKQ